MFIGLIEPDVYWQWIWSHSNTVPGFTNWESSQSANESVATKCVVLERTGLWYDVPCDESGYFFICEMLT